MEWIGLTLQILLLGIFLIWEGYNKKKGENLAMKEDSREINYEGEKGKNLATKEDIAQITKEIESVRNEISAQKQRETEYLYKRNECFVNYLSRLDELDLYRMKIFRISNTLGKPDISYQYLCDLENYILQLSKEFRLLIIYNPNKEAEEELYRIYNISNKLSNFLYDIIFRFYNVNITYTKLIQSPPKSDLHKKTVETEEEAKRIIKEYNDKITDLHKDYLEAIDGFNIYLEYFFSQKLHLKIDFKPNIKPKV